MLATILIPITILTTLTAYLIFCIQVKFAENTDLNKCSLSKYKIINNSVIHHLIIMVLTTSPLLILSMFLNNKCFFYFLFFSVFLQ
jgi:hypothetical protein